jgi:hypothetical protein
MSSLKEIIGQDVVNAAAKLGLNLDIPVDPVQRRRDQAFEFLTNASLRGDGEGIQNAAADLVLSILDKQDVAFSLAKLIEKINQYGDTADWFDNQGAE